MHQDNKVQLITYPDSLGGNLAALNNILETYFPDCFGGIHILPPFPSTGDRGFSPTTYFEIDPAFGSWQDIIHLSQNYSIMIDFMVNHISKQSKYFQDFQQKGRESAYADMFLPLDKIWEDGRPDPEDLQKIFLRRPRDPFLDVPIGTGEQIERIWATFGTENASNQIDLDVNAQVTRQFITEVADFFSQNGVSAVRLDAAAYVIKKAGTSCFMVAPEIYDFLEWITAEFESAGIKLLLEIHTTPELQNEIASHGYQVYNFILPFLILHTIVCQDKDKLIEHFNNMPHNQVTTLDCHDGIPVQPDVETLFTIEEARRIVKLCLERGANLNKIFNTDSLVDPTFDAHQINITYFSALNQDDDAYILARAIQFFSPGIPQVYYVGLLAGENKPGEITRTGEKRAINRYNYSVDEIQTEVTKPVVQRLLKLIRFRNQHPAFNGHFEVQKSGNAEFQLGWMDENQQCILDIDLKSTSCQILYTDPEGKWMNYTP